MRYVCLFAVITLILSAQVLSAQDGAAIYKERCASCHDSPEGRVPSLSAIKAMSGESIYVALTSGAMRTQAQGLSTAQIFALLGYIAPTGGAAANALTLTRTCKGDAAFPAPSFKSAMNAPRWNGWSTSHTNSRFQDAASAGLKATDVPALKLKWAFNLGAVTMARSQPTIVGGRVFIGALTGAVYSLDAETGCTHWGFKANAVRSGVTVGDANGVPAVFFGDGSATVYAVNAGTGDLLWKVRPVDHFATMATAAPQVFNGVVYQPFSSFEEALGPDPNFQCCTFRGSVVALEAATGKKIWQTFTIPETPKPTRKTAAGTQQHGPSGAGVWSTPTIDEKLGVLYVATGDNYSDPPTKTSDAILAMDLKTGELLWSRQLTDNDAITMVAPLRSLQIVRKRKDRILTSVNRPFWCSSGRTRERWSSARSREWYMPLTPTRKAQCCGRPAPEKEATWAAASGVPHRTARKSMLQFPTSPLVWRQTRQRRRVSGWF